MTLIFFFFFKAPEKCTLYVSFSIAPANFVKFLYREPQELLRLCCITYYVIFVSVTAHKLSKEPRIALDRSSINNKGPDAVSLQGGRPSHLQWIKTSAWTSACNVPLRIQASCWEDQVQSFLSGPDYSLITTRCT